MRKQEHGILKRRLGISSILIIFILVTITIFITIIIVNWIFGLWSTTEEEFVIRSYIYITHQELTNKPKLIIYVINSGAKSDKILKVEIKATNGMFINDTVIDIPADFKGTIEVDEWIEKGNPQIVQGNIYRVFIYTERHGLIFIDVVAQ